MRHDPTDKVEAQRADAPAPLRIVEQVAPRVGGLGRPPQTEVDVRTAACLVEERLRGERGDRPVLLRYAAYRLTHHDHVIRRPQRVGVADGQLLLAGT